MHSGRISQCYITVLEIRLSQNPRMHIQQRKKQLSRESDPGNLDNLHGRSAPRPLRHAAKDIVKCANYLFNAFSCEILPVDAVWSWWSCIYSIISFVFVNIISLAIQITVIMYFKILSLRLLPKMYVETYQTSSQWMKFSFSYALV